MTQMPGFAFNYGIQPTTIWITLTVQSPTLCKKIPCGYFVADTSAAAAAQKFKV